MHRWGDNQPWRARQAGGSHRGVAAVPGRRAGRACAGQRTKLARPGGELPRRSARRGDGRPREPHLHGGRAAAPRRRQRRAGGTGDREGPGSPTSHRGAQVCPASSCSAHRRGGGRPRAGSRYRAQCGRRAAGLHLGHDGSSQGRAAHPCQPAGLHPRGDAGLALAARRCAGPCFAADASARPRRRACHAAGRFARRDPCAVRPGGLVRRDPR